jgi:nucleoside-diphosphate-sugar epimerase
MSSQNKRFAVSILGCGWYGLALAKSLIKEGYLVKGSTTSIEKLESLQEFGIKSYQVDFSTENEVYSPKFFQSDVLFIAIPPKRKSGEVNSYPQKIKAICKAAADGRIKHVILISSTGVYGNTGQVLNELNEPIPASESGHALLLAENIVITQENISSTIIRFGGLFGPDRDPGRFLKGKQAIPNGLAPVNMIHLNDCLGISHLILEQASFGRVYNACSPQHPSRIDFYSRSAIKASESPPDFIRELKEWKIVDSVNIPLYLKYIFKEELIS